MRVPVDKEGNIEAAKDFVYSGIDDCRVECGKKYIRRVVDLVRWPKPWPPSRQWEGWREEYGKRIWKVGEKCNDVRAAAKPIEVVV